MIMLPRSTSPWTEIEDRVETLPWEKRNFPLSEEELSEMEVGLVFFLLLSKYLLKYFLLMRNISG